MKHLVLGPVSGLVVLLLLLLMVQLAGLGGIKQVAVPPMQAPASFNMGEIDFSPTAALSVSEFDPIALPESVQTQVDIPEITLALDFVEPELDITLTDPQVEDVVFEDLIEPLENGLVEIPNPVIAKAIVARKPLVKKTKVQPKKVVKNPVKRTMKKVAQKPPVKVFKSAKKLPFAKTGSSKSSADDAVGVNAASNKVGTVTQNGSALSKPISRVRPAYPKRARRRGIEGEVVISFLVNANGSVDKSSLRITSARPAKIFNKAVLKAVARWKFSKAARAYRNTQRLVFKLDK